MGEKNLLKIAQKAREDFLSKRIDKETLKKDYFIYNPITNIDEFIEKAKHLFPKLNCGLTTAYLREIIGKGEIIKGKYKQNNHTFLLVDKIVVDITADQYDGPEVYVGKLDKPWALN